MAGKLSFAVAINLLTDNFKKGTNNVKAQLKAIQYQVLTFAAALGASGIGLSNFLSKLIEVGRETSRANTLLKNVSTSTLNYAENLKFVSGLANKYGIYINDLTSNYAKFSAAANISGMSLQKQQDLFESLSRASVAFGMSADDTNGMFLAITQMMGKGKIQAEELRGQLGERLPIAMQAMAKAAGTSVAGLDSIMKKGQLLSAKVLPDFANALNEMIPNVNTDNIETSVNRFRNAFQELTSKLNVGGIYKKIVDSATSELERLKNGVSDVVSVVISLIVGKLGSKLLSWFGELSAHRQSLVKQAEIAQTQIALATEKKVAAEKVLEATVTDYNTIENGKRLATKKQVNAAELALERAKAVEKKAILTAETMNERAALVASSSRYGAFFTTIRLGYLKVAASLKAMFLSIAPMAIISGITYLITNLINVRKETERIKNMFSDYKKEAEKVTHTPEIQQLKVLQDLYNKAAKGSVIKQKYQNRIIELLGGELKKNQDINDAIRDRIKLLEATAKTDFYARSKVENEDKVRQIYNKYGGKEGFDIEYRKDAAHYSNTMLWFGNKPQSINDMAEVTQLQKEIAYANSELSKYTEFTVKNTTTTPPTDDGDDDKKKKTDLEKAEEEYTKSLKELTNQKLNGTFKKEAEYNKALDELNKATYKKLSGLLSPVEAAKNETFQTVKAGADNPLTSKTYEIEADYQNELKKLTNQKANGALTEEEYNKKLRDLITSTLAAAGSLDDIGITGKAFITALKFTEGKLKEKFVLPKEEKRDTTFDYKKTNVDKLTDEKAAKEKYVDSLKSKATSDVDKLIEDIKSAQGNIDIVKAKYAKEAPELIEALNNAMNNVKSLDEALKIAQVKEDVKELEKELNKGLYSGVKDIANSADRLFSSFESLNDVMNDADTSSWEKILALFNALTQTLDSFMSIIDTIQTLTEVTEKLGLAKQAEAAIDSQVTAQKLSNTAVSIAADTTEAETKKANSRGVVAANTAEAATEAAKSVAGIPFVGLALAAAAVTGIIALFSSLPKFANGGIVGGHSKTGDKVLAGLNSGEMVLNESQQSRLFRMLNGGKATNNGNSVIVSGKVIIRGGDTFLSLSNYMRQTGKRLPR